MSTPFKKVVNNNQITIAITNSGASDLRALLTPGNLGPLAKGLISSSAFKGITADGAESAAADLKASIINSNISIQDFLFQISEGTIVVNKIRTFVKGDATGMIDKITFEQFRFGQPANPIELLLANYFDPSTTNEKVVDASVALGLDKFVKTTIYDIPAKSTVKIILFVVAIQNENDNLQDIIVNAIGGNVISGSNDSITDHIEQKLDNQLLISQDYQKPTSNDSGYKPLLPPTPKPTENVMFQKPATQPQTASTNFFRS